MGNVTWDIAQVKDRAAVSCSPSTYVLGANRIRDLVDGQAGLCMGRCMGRAWVHGGLGVYNPPTTFPHHAPMNRTCTDPTHTHPTHTYMDYMMLLQQYYNNLSIPEP